MSLSHISVLLLQPLSIKRVPQELHRESDTRFSTSGFFHESVSPRPPVFHWGCFEFFQKFAEIFANEYLSPVSLTPAINCSGVSTTPAKNVSPVSTIPAINPCHGEITKKPKSLNCSLVSTTPPINYSAVSTTPAIKESCLY
jgi:hypothetical protein